MWVLNYWVVIEDVNELGAFWEFILYHMAGIFDGGTVLTGSDVIILKTFIDSGEFPDVCLVGFWMNCKSLPVGLLYCIAPPTVRSNDIQYSTDS